VAGSLGGLAIAAAVPALALLAIQQVTAYATVSRPQVPLWSAVMEPVTGGPAVAAAVLAVATLLLVALKRPD
jgi:hypothetical protein